ncbi:hypothetical protein ABDK56_06635 [Sphingomonas sp. ASV193]|uniref:tetratricopeptide repeat protein n=1 Tax=Sphingomonas sp. ASV193 TaxID=3144405 RepID=UPI0032E90A76
MIALLIAAALAGAAPTCSEDSTGLLCQALAASDSQKFVDAAGLFERAADASPVGNPRTQRMWAAAGNMWIAAGQPAKAAADLDKALAGDGLQAEQRGLALLDRARAAEGQGDLAAARRFATEAAPNADKDPFYWYFSAALAVRENDLGTARSAIARALALGPGLADVLFEAGYIAHLGGKDEEARDYWTRAAAADAGGPVAASAKRELDALGAKIPPEPKTDR